MTFGSYLCELRTAKNIRQCQLAKAIGISRGYVCDIEKGKRNPPSIEKLRAWQEFLSLSEKETAMYYELAGMARNTVAPDVLEYIVGTPAAKEAIRRILEKRVDFDWDSVANG